MTTTTEPIDVEVVDALVPVTHDLITAAPTAAVAEVQRQYHELCTALLDDSDYQTIGSRRFRKKSGWRKLSVAFNVSTELLDRVYERDAAGRILRAECVVRATAPNGRYVDGFGACDRTEKCCPAKCRKTGRHVHCAADCDGRPHFSNPSHDVPATAMTRAANRSLSDLFGMGEVSAEEITDSGGDWTEPAVDPAADAAMAALAEIIRSVEPDDERLRLADYLKVSFGPSAEMPPDRIAEAIRVAAGWPATAPL